MRAPAGVGLMMLGAWLAAPAGAVSDPHSHANTDDFRATHAVLDLTADFQREVLTGSVELQLQRLDPQARELVLDTRDLTIGAVELLREAGSEKLEYRLGERDAILGAPLHVSLPAAGAQGDELRVRIRYETSPQASGLQWLKPQQTAGKRHPFMFSQSQAVHARSWIPLQDTPAVRLTYEARIRTPKELVAVMSAQNDPDTPRDGEYHFEMPQPIPSYLFALGVGDLQFKPAGPRTGVYAEAQMLASASHEFADVEDMLRTCERLFGPYRWGRYDLLILPPSFMWGGMENPRLSFITPTAIAGDRSLVALIAHELAHSWSGNLVTNANWNSSWLNEGFTVYLERRIVEVLYGDQRRAMEDVLGLQSLVRTIDSLTEGGEPQLTQLAMDLRGRDPDDGFSDVIYEKGRLFVGFLESRLGRERLDAFLREYFDHFAFQSIDTDAFVKYLDEHLLQQTDAVSMAEVRQWIYEPGIPATAVLPASDAFTRVDEQRDAWLAGTLAAQKLDTQDWTTQQWLHFLDNMPALSVQQMEQLETAFKFSAAGNSEIVHSWLRNAIRAGYRAADAQLESYLTSIGRRKLVMPLYQELVKSQDGAQRARAIYAKARALYQVPLAAQLDELMK